MPVNPKLEKLFGEHAILAMTDNDWADTFTAFCLKIAYDGLNVDELFNVAAGKFETNLEDLEKCIMFLTSRGTKFDVSKTRMETVARDEVQKLFNKYDIKFATPNNPVPPQELTLARLGLCFPCIAANCCKIADSCVLADLIPVNAYPLRSPTFSSLIPKGLKDPVAKALLQLAVYLSARFTGIVTNTAFASCYGKVAKYVYLGCGSNVVDNARKVEYLQKAGLLVEKTVGGSKEWKLSDTINKAPYNDYCQKVATWVAAEQDRKSAFARGVLKLDVIQ